MQGRVEVIGAPRPESALLLPHWARKADLFPIQDPPPNPKSRPGSRTEPRPVSPPIRPAAAPSVAGQRV